ncbi:MAG: hypothetical protein U5R06_17270 [candidate division KSB1 bacterium]|nr:hypothetical protein [candidate division KSB1 bacterium]
MPVRLYFLLFLIFLSCQTSGIQTGPPVNIIFDTDMGSDCDDAGALALLHAYADQNKAEILGCVYTSGRVPYGAGVVQAINIACGRPAVPVGAYHGTDVGDPVDKMSAEKLAKDTTAFGNTLDDGRPSWDLATVYFAVEGTGAFLQNKGYGRLEFNIDKGSRWQADPTHRQQTYISQKPDISTKFADNLNRLIADQSKGVPR